MNGTLKQILVSDLEASSRGQSMYQQRVKLLLVDGNLERVSRIADRLRHLKFQVEIATNGAAGLLKTHEERPDVIVVAADLPILDGYRMTDALRSKPQTVELPVILLTEHGSDEEVARGWKCGADFCLPWDQRDAEIFSALHQVLARLSPVEGCSAGLSLVC
jgi:DNA-binding response OmpR family regulator